MLKIKKYIWEVTSKVCFCSTVKNVHRFHQFHVFENEFILIFCGQIIPNYFTLESEYDEDIVALCPSTNVFVE